METLNQDSKTVLSTTNRASITVAHGDGIGPEIMQATLAILKAAGAELDIEEIEVGESVYKDGHTSGIRPEAWESLRRTRTFLKAPITTPQGGGFKSLNVTIRKTLGLYANVRPCVSYHPYVKTKHPKMDLVIVRENEEDLYAGIEHRQTDEVYQCLKIITRPGTEKIVRYAFEFARANGRKKVTCFTKDNIMKLTDGLFHKVFEEIGLEYPELEKEHWIVDIGAAKMADTPEIFDVLVMPNLYGDILSDVAAQIAGSVGLAGSSNIGEGFAMFEAIHGSAPRRAGQDKANPSGLLQGAVLMMTHLGQSEVAERIQNAWLRTLEDGIHTYDLASAELTKETVGTQAFAKAVIERLGQVPQKLPLRKLSGEKHRHFPLHSKVDRAGEKRETIGVDVFLCASGQNPNELGELVSQLGNQDLKLKMITNRGVKVWPEGMPETFCTDHWRCRFISPEQRPIQLSSIVSLLGRFQEAGLEFIKTENLCTFGGEKAYSLGQGE